MGGYIGVGIVLLILGFGLAFLIIDIRKRINNSNKYKVCFKKGFKKCGLPLIKLKINGKLEWFLLDTGANSNVLKDSYFNNLELKPEKIKESTYHSAENELSSFEIECDLSYNKTNFKDEQFTVAKLNTFEEPWNGFNIIGIIGSPFFSRYRFQFDFEDLVVWINKK